MRLGKWFLFLALFQNAALGCNGKNSEPGEAGQNSIQIVCTTGMVADLVSNVGGDRVHVETLIGADVDPHLFKASLEDVAKLRKADMIFYSGLHLEGKMSEILEKLGAKKPTFAIADSLQASQVLQDEKKATDPHVWHDVGLWSRGTGGVAKALAEFDPTHAADFQKRAAAYRAKLGDVHEEIKKTIASIPSKQRVLVTSHDAFRYFSRAYDIEVKSLQGISTDAEASVQDINELVDFICARGIKAVFVESSVNERNMDAVLEGCRARKHRVVKGGTLYSDALGKAGTPEGTYIGMVRHNADTIVKALR